jgi:thiosulfate/3-mercaptopyruvate sulfurtransferase
VTSLLIDPATLAERLAHGGPLRVLDARPASQFATGHVPGAFHLDPFGISLIDSRPAPLKAWEWVMQHLLELRGVTRDEAIVVYEEGSGMRAARLVWVLALFGHANARLLDGGIARWRAERRPVTREAAAEPETASILTVERRPETMATVEDVLAALDRPEVAIVDARSRAEYTGSLVRAARGGAIPRAVHLEYTANLTPDGRYRQPSELRSMYEALGVSPDREVITYCQGGYRAAQSWIALHEAGYPRVRSYVGSWNEWGNRTDLPVVQPTS